MFCPGCGVKNDPGTLKCFVCGKIIPSPQDSAERTPRPRRPHLPPTTEMFASVGDRMLAMLFDRVLVAAILSIPVAVFFEQVHVALWIATLTILIFAYHLFFEGAFGATLGKAIFGLRVRGNGSRGPFGTAAIRNALRLVDGIPLYGLGFVTALFSSRKQRIGDHLAHAVVIEQRVHWTTRGGWILLWLMMIAAALGYAAYLRPDLTRF